MSRKEDKLNKKQLEEKKNQLQSEIQTLKNVIEASNSPIFDLLVNEVKKDMERNIAQEDWKSLKSNQKKVEAYRKVEQIIQNQQELLERKEEELEDINFRIENYQPGLFDVPDVQDTGFYMEEFRPEDDSKTPIETGDIFSVTDKNTGYVKAYKIIPSKENGKYAIVGNEIEGELLLNYPKNREILKDAVYVGNIFYGEDIESAKEIEKLI